MRAHVSHFVLQAHINEQRRLKQGLEGVVQIYQQLSSSEYPLVKAQRVLLFKGTGPLKEVQAPSALRSSTPDMDASRCDLDAAFRWSRPSLTLRSHSPRAGYTPRADDTASGSPGASDGANSMGNALNFLKVRLRLRARAPCTAPDGHGSACRGAHPCRGPTRRCFRARAGGCPARWTARRWATFLRTGKPTCLSSTIW